MASHLPPPSSPNDSVDVVRDNFEAMLPAVEAALRDCTFFAIDCEMTGLFLEGSRESFLDEMPDRYARLRESSQSFVVNQFGLSCFTAAPRAADSSTNHPAGLGYTASTFNFYLFPEPLVCGRDQSRRFVSDSGSLSFLAKQGFDFNKWIYQGIPYLPAPEYQRLLREAQGAYTARRGNGGPAVVSKEPADLAFVARVKQQLSTWLERSDGSMLELPGGSGDMNGFRRLLAFQEIHAATAGLPEQPAVFVKKVETNNGYARMQLTRGSPAEIKAMQEEDVREKVEAVNAAAGFTRVLDAMRKSNKPAVGHNCMMDFSYVLAACVEPKLPPTWPEYKAMVANWFPGGIYDTKYLSKRLPEVFEGATALGDVYKAVTQDGDKRSRGQSMAAELAGRVGDPFLQMPWVAHLPGFEKYAKVDAGALAHEAGYDAFMTGCAFASLAVLTRAHDIRGAAAAAAAVAAAAAAAAAAGAAPEVVEPTPSPSVDACVEGVEPTLPEGMDVDDAAGGVDGVDGVDEKYDPMCGVQQYMGRLNLMRTDMPHASLFGEDPPISRPNVFHVSGLTGQRIDDVQKMFQELGARGARVTWTDRVDCSAALVEVDNEAASRVAAAMAEGGVTGDGKPKVVTYAEFSAERAMAASAAASAAAEEKAQQYAGRKRSRSDVTPVPAAAAAVAEAPAAAGEVPPGGWCSVQ
ncbi:hypothetical protein FOA52_008523 [Chlamydomonas sp. UWO 241]|nr:hypothetical protein FOA52_008523 [Chlamydomonas sp. UWO 241]